MMDVLYCPKCASKLTREPYDDDGGWCECPIHGEIHVEYYKPRNSLHPKETEK